MASVHRDPRNPKGVWYCRFRRRDGSRAWCSTGQKSKSQAKIVCEALQAAEDEAARGELSSKRVTKLLNETLQRLGVAKVERPTAERYLNDWLTTKDNVSPAALQHYRFAISGFLSSLAQPRKLLEQVTERDVAGFLASLKAEGRTSRTLNRIRQNLSTPFGRARKLGLIRFNPVMLTAPEKADRIRRETFSPEDVARLVKAAVGTDWEGLVLLGYGSGLRLQDGANLRWSEVDLEFGVVNFSQRKTGKNALVGLHPDFGDWLLGRRSAPDDPQAYIFPSLAKRASGGRNGLTNEFNGLMTRAGLVDHKMRQPKGCAGRSLRSRSFHSFRHGAASEIFNSAIAKEAARRITAHSGEALQRYLHADLSGIRAAVALIPRLPK
jgi:integrase